MNRANGHIPRQLPSEPSNGRQYTAKELKALKTHREALEIQQQIKHLQRAHSLTESLWRDWDDDDAWLRIRGGDSDTQIRNTPPSQPSDRKHGKNWPIWDNEYDLDLLRQKARILCDDNGFARGYLRNLVNFVWYKGITFKAQSKEDIDVDPEKPGLQEGDRIKSAEKSLQNFIDRWCRYNRFNCAADPRDGRSPTGVRGREIVKRVFRDGDSFTRFFFDERGMSRIRPVEPEQIRNGSGCNSEEGWSFGIKHQVEGGIEDVETIESYCIVYPASMGPTQEIVDAAEIVHIKDSETDSTIKRGTTFFRGDVFDALYRASALQRNISVGAGVRAATAEIWKTTFGTKDQITELSKGLRQHQATDPITGKQYDLHRRRPGEVVRVPDGYEPVMPPPQTGAVSEPMQGVQGDCKQAGAAGAMPEQLISSDYSNSTYSNAKEAGTPFIRGMEAEQEHFKQAFLVIIWKAVRHAVDCGMLGEEVMELCDIQVEAAEITSTDKLQKAQVDQLLNAMRVKSQHTIAMEWGLDPEEQEANFQEWEEQHGAGQGLTMPGEDEFGGGLAGMPQPPPKWPLPGLESLLRENTGWDEAKHPRDRGKFSSKPGAGGDDKISVITPQERLKSAEQAVRLAAKEFLGHTNALDSRVIHAEIEKAVAPFLITPGTPDGRRINANIRKKAIEWFEHGASFDENGNFSTYGKAADERAKQSNEARRRAEEEREIEDKQKRQTAAHDRTYVVGKLKDLGFKHELTTDSGSQYYRNGLVIVRISDHEVPLTHEREQTINTGGKSWANSSLSFVGGEDEPDLWLEAVSKRLETVHGKSELPSGFSLVRQRTTESLHESAGTCKQGERSDLTGCTPATDDPSQSKPRMASIKPKPVREGFHGIVRQADGTYHAPDGGPLPDEVTVRVKALRLPPAWRSVQVSSDPTSPLQAVGYDAKGREQYVYSAEHSAKAAAEKFLRVKAMVDELPRFDEKLRKVLKEGTEAEKEAVACIMLIRKTGFRIGGEGDTGAEKKAYGASTMETRHVTVDGDRLTFAFVGKKGVDIRQTVEDAELAALIGPRLKKKGRLFNTSPGEVRDVFHANDGENKVKDLRTIVAAETALGKIAEMKPPRTEKEFKRHRAEVGKAVAERLGNTPAVALASYIPPEVFQSWNLSSSGF